MTCLRVGASSHTCEPLYATAKGQQGRSAGALIHSDHTPRAFNSHD